MCRAVELLRTIYITEREFAAGVFAHFIYFADRERENILDIIISNEKNKIKLFFFDKNMKLNVDVLYSHIIFCVFNVYNLNHMPKSTEI